MASARRRRDEGNATKPPRQLRGSLRSAVRLAATDGSDCFFIDNPFAQHCAARRGGNVKLQMPSQTLPHYPEKTYHTTARASECACREAIGLPEAKPSLRSKSPEAAPRKFRQILRMRSIRVPSQQTKGQMSFRDVLRPTLMTEDPLYFLVSPNGRGRGARPKRFRREARRKREAANAIPDFTTMSEHMDSFRLSWFLRMSLAASFRASLRKRVRQVTLEGALGPLDLVLADAADDFVREVGAEDGYFYLKENL